MSFPWQNFHLLSPLWSAVSPFHHVVGTEDRRAVWAVSKQPSMWGDVSKQPTVEMWATHWVIVSPNDAIPGKRETESLPYLILNTYLQPRNGLTDDSFGVVQAVSNIFHLWSGKKRQKGVWTLVRLRFREYARQRPALSDTLYPPSPLP